jgi:hypothetical protein
MSGTAPETHNTAAAAQAAGRAAVVRAQKFLDVHIAQRQLARTMTASILPTDALRHRVVCRTPAHQCTRIAFVHRISGEARRRWQPRAAQHSSVPLWRRLQTTTTLPRAVARQAVYGLPGKAQPASQPASFSLPVINWLHSMPH